MKIVRKNIFETNSSSTHSLVVPHEVADGEYSLYDSLNHDYSFGRSAFRMVESWDEKLAYVYKVLLEFENAKAYGVKKNENLVNKEQIELFRKTVNELYDEVYNILEYKPYENDPRPNDIFRRTCDAYVDHIMEIDHKLIKRLLNDREFVKKLIFNKESYIVIGSDEERGYYIKRIGFEYDYGDPFDDDNDFWAKLEDYEKHNDVYLKGN